MDLSRSDGFRVEPGRIWNVFTILGWRFQCCVGSYDVDSYDVSFGNEDLEQQCFNAAFFAF